MGGVADLDDVVIESCVVVMEIHVEGKGTFILMILFVDGVDRKVTVR